MRHDDFVSDGFLAVTAASLVLLCSGCLAASLILRLSPPHHPFSERNKLARPPLVETIKGLPMPSSQLKRAERSI